MTDPHQPRTNAYLVLQGTLEGYVSLSIVIHLDPHISQVKPPHLVQTANTSSKLFQDLLTPSTRTSGFPPIPISQHTTLLLPPIPTNHPHITTPSPSSITILKSKAPASVHSPSQHSESATPSHPSFQNPHLNHRRHRLLLPPSTPAH
jgi:hypothetical protein